MKTTHILPAVTAILLCVLLVSCSRLQSPAVEDGDPALTQTDLEETDAGAITPVADGQTPAPLADTDSASLTREETLIASLTIFVLAIFVGFEVITKVPPTLHTPLMSGSNAISGITIVGAALMAGSGENRWAMFLGLLAVIFATVNVVGGFLVTDRMLAMFKRK